MWQREPFGKGVLKKNPSKAPKWWNREGKSSETSNANVELVVPSIELRQDFA
jgi:hypothetical protein